ncbi:MAG TPA: tRNA glutamyl-Q(34) synthetase GluQRS, partial [Roseiarcus sp.]|nr:tRNA glutamyl-Q(34) synthetase GluQRS [Roseiarcus sp.]
MNERAAQRFGGRLLLRMEDLDRSRCKREYEEGALDNLDWLGLVFEEPPRRQSEHVRDYAEAYAALAGLGALYPCYCTKADVEKAWRAGKREVDPDGHPLYPGVCRALKPDRRGSSATPPILRLDMRRALALAPVDLFWREFGEGDEERIERADPAAWGDVALKRRGATAAYHVAVVIDDELQGVTDVVRGRDLFSATSLHRLLQHLLRIEPPRYRHHRLVLDAKGEKMSKSAAATPLDQLRSKGISPA